MSGVKTDISAYSVCPGPPVSDLKTSHLICSHSPWKSSSPDSFHLQPWRVPSECQRQLCINHSRRPIYTHSTAMADVEEMRNPPPIPNAVPRPQRKRRRPALACEECRQRKIKCDHSTPCDQCTRSKSKTCTYQYPPDDNPTPAPVVRMGMRVVGVTGQGQNPNPIQIHDLDQSQNQSQNQVQNGMDNGNDENSNHSHSNVNPSTSPTVDRVQALLDRVQSLEKTLQDATKSAALDPPVIQTASAGSKMPMKGTFDKTRYFGQSHWMNSLDQV